MAVTALARNDTSVEARIDVPNENHERALDDAVILIVDDDERSATLSRRMLCRFGFRHVTTTIDVHSALARVYDGAVDVMILDIHMPDLDGFAVLRELSGMRHSGLAPAIVAVSGDASPLAHRAILAAGADDFVQRPCDGAEFALRVRRAAITSRRNRAMRARLRGLEIEVRSLSVRLSELECGNTHD